MKAPEQCAHGAGALQSHSPPEGPSPRVRVIPRVARVTACNLASVPLPGKSLDVAIFCLALMGTDWVDFVTEAKICGSCGGSSFCAGGHHCGLCRSRSSNILAGLKVESLVLEP